MKGVYEPKIQHNWKITGVDLTAPERADVVELINDGIMSVPTTEDGKYTNIASINILDTVTQEEIDALSAKAGVSAAQFVGVKTKGAFYQQLNKARKTNDNGEGATTPTPEKPTTPTVPKPTPGTSKPGKPSTPNTGKPGNVNKGKQAKVTAAYLNVRAGASSKAKVVAAVPKGTVLEVISTDKYGWVKVKLDGRVAFVYGKYVSILK